MSRGNLWAILSGSRYSYVMATILVSIIAFSRNLLFMKTLNLAELGQIVLMQTMIMLIGFLPFGLINGAYIQYATQDRETNRRLVSLMGTMILLLLLLCGGITLLLVITGVLDRLILRQTLIFGMAAGVATLASTWLNNALIADRKLLHSNLVNLGAVALSVLVALLSRHHGMTAALASLLVQPLVATIAFLLLIPSLRPHRFELNRELLAGIYRLGAMPFLAGLAVLLMDQIERWAIATNLGSEALGNFYIVLMFSAFFILIPSALLNYYFPMVRENFFAGNMDRVIALVKKHTRDLFLYYLLALTVTAALMQIVVDWMFPEFSAQLYLVYLAIPGLIFLTLRNTSSIIFFSTGKMRPMIWAGGITILLFILAILILVRLQQLSLLSILLVRAGATLAGTAYLLLAKRRQLAHMSQPA